MTPLTPQRRPNERGVMSYPKPGEPLLLCVLCGMIVIVTSNGWTAPYKCVANGGGDHIRPGSPGAEKAKQLHAAWLRDPFAAPPPLDEPEK